MGINHSLLSVWMINDGSKDNTPSWAFLTSVSSFAKFTIQHPFYDLVIMIEFNLPAKMSFTSILCSLKARMPMKTCHMLSKFEIPINRMSTN